MSAVHLAVLPDHVQPGAIAWLPYADVLRGIL